MCGSCRSRALSRESQSNVGSAPPAIYEHLDLPPGERHEMPCDCQTHPLSAFLKREHRLEHALRKLGRNPRTVIGKEHLTSIAIGFHRNVHERVIDSMQPVQGVQQERMKHPPEG